jgi:putative nucleotidyltransferase with HDIG domain
MPELCVSPELEVTRAKVRILIVDNEPSIGRLLADKLRPQGFDCAGCRSGQEALNLLDLHKFDAILSDFHMPSMNGLELMRLVRERDPQLAFMLITAVDDARVAIQAMREGSDDYLLKPLDLSAVLVSVKRMLERRKLRIELENYRSHLEEIVEQRTEELRMALRQVGRTYDETLEALASAMDLRDNTTAGHSRRVMAYCVEIAKALGCNEEELRTIARGALLHDIGKIGIADAILAKPSSLTYEERATMETHVRIGYTLLSRVAFLASAAEIILAHHERFDGNGYPRQLAGREIPLGARIFAVADALDAMTSDRPYRAALPFAAAREEILRESGKQFDPRVVSTFLRIDENVWKNIREGKLTPPPDEASTRVTLASYGQRNPQMLTARITGESLPASF